MSMYCSKCGSEILVNEKFCGGCGNKVIAIHKEQIQEIHESLPYSIQLISAEIKASDSTSEKISESKNEIRDSTIEISNLKKEATSIIEKNKIEKAPQDFIETIFEKLEHSGKGNSVLALIIFTIASFGLTSFINHTEVLAKFLVFIPAVFLWFKWLRRIEFF